MPLMAPRCPVLPPSAGCFALLDDCSATAEDPRSRLYTEHAGTLVCHGANGLGGLFDAMNSAMRGGLHAVGMFSYELGAALHGVAAAAPAGNLARILLFGSQERLSSAQVRAWLDARGGPAPPGVTGLRANIDEARYCADIARIQAYIERGDTYQVNYTFGLNFQAHGSPHGLYARLRARQPVPYGALIGLPGGEAVLSLSPELFIQHHGGELVARPMKGTAPAGADDSSRASRTHALAVDPKNRAENLMIVDLLRNDIGRIALTGSVTVPSLFDVAAFGTVLQMTSTIRGRIAPEAELADLFAALYPCGSITGAPKRRTMEIINELEGRPRGLYTGAIGWFESAGRQQRKTGDFCLSVPIRTLELGAVKRGGARNGRMGIGSGIVRDSDANAEFRECWLKAGFLHDLAYRSGSGTSRVPDGCASAAMASSSAA